MLKVSTIEHCRMRSWLCLLVIWEDYTKTKGTAYVYNFCIIISRYLPQRFALMDATANSTSPFFLSRLHCECQHNTCGESCDRCCPGFNQKPWRSATVDSPNECQRKCEVFELSLLWHPSSQAELLINMEDSRWLCTGKGCSSFCCKFIVPREA